MARAINVKVATVKVIKGLEDKIANNKKIVTENENKRKAHKVTLEKYHKQIVKDYAKDLEIDSINKRWSGTLEVSYKISKDAELPEAPQLELERELASWEVDEIENAIRLLKMTDEETVNASTFKSIAQYL